MTRVPAFWDSSAVVPLGVRQSKSSQLKALYATSKPVIWWATPVEVASALARLLKTMDIDLAEWRKARGLFLQLDNAWSVVQPSESLRSQASDLVEHYDLRAADAFQLAAALAWCEHKPAGRHFVSLDGKLREASLMCGFDAQQL
jgi:predicted nucleic acid-binding protein